MWDCIKSEGQHLGTCSDRFLFGSCCYHNSTFNDIDIQRHNNTSESNIDTRLQPTVIPTTSPTTFAPTTTFLQSASSLSDHLNSLASHKQQISASATSFQADNQNQSWLGQNPLSANSNNVNNNYNATDEIPNRTPNWANEENKVNLSTHVIEHLPTQAPATTTVATQNVTYSQDLGLFSRPYAQQVQYMSEQTNSIVALHSPSSRPTTNPVTVTQQIDPTPHTNQVSQKPASGSWLSRPASLIANAFFHSFKPFPYLNQNRQRPTHRPQVNSYRPSPQRPIVMQQKPPPLLGGGPQLVNNGGEIVTSSSENSFSNLYNVSSSTVISNSSVLQDNNDHHIVNPSSPSMTDRRRPIDKNHFNHFNDGLELNQKQHHYEIVSNSSSVANQMSSNVSYSQNEANYATHTHFNSSAPIALEPIDQTSVTLQSNLSNSQANISPVVTEHANTNYNSHSGYDVGIATPIYSNYEQPKPVVMVEQQHNGSVNYPSYTLIQAFTSGSAHEQHVPENSHFSTLNPIDEIHGLSVDQFSPPPRGNSTMSTTASSHIEYYNQNQQSQLTTTTGATMGYGGQFGESNSPDISQQSQKPSSSEGTQSLSPITTTIGDLNPTTALSATTSTAVQDVTNLSPPTSTLAPKIPNLNLNANNGAKKGTSKEATCGVTALYPQTKVVGGKNAAFGAWPWQVSVRKVSFFGFSSTHRCGGAVISSEWIATAGHCVEDLALQSIRIRVGEYDFSSMSEPFPYIERAARRKVVHPKYNFYTYENDLALVQLDQPIQFPPHVAPICLPPDNIDLLGRNATVTGWGRLNEGGTLPTVLQEVRVPIVSNDKCKDMFLSAGRPEYIPDIFLCAGYEEGGRDSCQGDSGGPLQVKGDDGKWFLAGIISWGIGCAEQNLPGVCTRISRFKLWIQSTMNSSS